MSNNQTQTRHVACVLVIVDTIMRHFYNNTLYTHRYNIVYILRLYVANVGDSRALLCQEANGQIMASQLSDDHNVFNPGELNRLTKLGLNSEMLKQYRRLGPFQVTRSIGDYAIKGGYREVDTLRLVKKMPSLNKDFEKS